MKSKLFKVAIIPVFYSFFVLVYMAADQQGIIAQAFDTVGLSNSSAVASPSYDNQTDLTTSDIAPDMSESSQTDETIHVFRRPFPPKPKPEPPGDMSITRRPFPPKPKPEPPDDMSITRRPFPPKPKPEPPGDAV